jgi:nicotinamide-nucleotide amidase
MTNDDLVKRAGQLLERYRDAGLKIVTAESCTGGLLAATLTDVPGSSAVFERGFVTYSNAAKIETIGVDAALLTSFGAVSMQVARAMAEGALRASAAHVALAITGIAGPGGATADKPVGLVHFGLARRDGGTRSIERLYGDLSRSEIRRRAVEDALKLLESAAP